MKLIVLAIVSFALGAICFASMTRQDRTADAAAIRAHIGSIFQAFIDGDEQKIYDTHSEDWRGLLEGTPAPIKGIDEYMRANGIDWPKPANAPKRTSYFAAGTTYKMSDFDVHFYNPELAVANFIGEFNSKSGETLRRFRIMDIYAKRKGNWIQVASHTAIDPQWREEQNAQPRNITPDVRERLLHFGQRHHRTAPDQQLRRRHAASCGPDNHHPSPFNREPCCHGITATSASSG